MLGQMRKDNSSAQTYVNPDELQQTGAETVLMAAEQRILANQHFDSQLQVRLAASDIYNLAGEMCKVMQYTNILSSAHYYAPLHMCRCMLAITNCLHAMFIECSAAADDQSGVMLKLLLQDSLPCTSSDSRTAALVWEILYKATLQQSRLSKSS